MCVETLRTVLVFPRRSIWGVTCLGLHKNECFHIYLLVNTINVCWNPQNGTFSKTINLRGNMPRSYSKNEHFPIYLLRRPINVCWNPQNRAYFSKMTNLRGHMPRFSWHMNVFLPMSLETRYMCVKTLRTGLVFPRQVIWGVTCLGLL